MISALLLIAAVFVVGVRFLLPNKGPVLILSAWPNVLLLYLQVLVSALTKGKKARQGRSQAAAISVELKNPQPFNRRRLALFRYRYWG